METSVPSLSLSSKLDTASRRRQFEFENAGANLEREGAVGIEMPKFEAKRAILQKFGKNWGLQPPQATPPMQADHN